MCPRQSLKYVAENTLARLTLLPPTPECLDHRHELPRLTCLVLGIDPRDLVHARQATLLSELHPNSTDFDLVHALSPSYPFLLLISLPPLALFGGQKIVWEHFTH